MTMDVIERGMTVRENWSDIVGTVIDLLDDGNVSVQWPSRVGISRVEWLVKVTSLNTCWRCGKRRYTNDQMCVHCGANP